MSAADCTLMFNTLVLLWGNHYPSALQEKVFSFVRTCMVLGKRLLPAPIASALASWLFLIKTSVGKILHNNRSYQAASQSGGMSEGHPIHCNWDHTYFSCLLKLNPGIENGHFTPQEIKNQSLLQSYLPARECAVQRSSPFHILSLSLCYLIV